MDDDDARTSTRQCAIRRQAHERGQCQRRLRLPLRGWRRRIEASHAREHIAPTATFIPGSSSERQCHFARSPAPLIFAVAPASHLSRVLARPRRCRGAHDIRSSALRWWSTTTTTSWQQPIALLAFGFARHQPRPAISGSSSSSGRSQLVGLAGALSSAAGLFRDATAMQVQGVRVDRQRCAVSVVAVVVEVVTRSADAHGHA
jgi:hypothetical protein